MCNAYTLLNGLTYNPCGYFVSCDWKNTSTSNEQNVHEYYNKKFIIPLQKRGFFASILFGKSV